MLNCVSAEPITSHRGEQETCAIIFTLFPDPRRQHNDTGFGQWSTSFLASFTFTSNMRSLTEADVLSSNRGDLENRLPRFPCNGQPGSNAQDELSTLLAEVGFVEVKSLFTFYPRE